MTTAKSTGNIFTKVSRLLGSIRFWTITLSAASWAAANPEHIPEAISAWLAAVAAVGTVDKASGHGTP